ncbi:MBL fold metallo-hydrolase [Stenotrophomonas sp. SY1]|uniref:MBL fold metallo-hydrolase n=1 Tax=Stenotrophomonas sp. SY1 TaxID=477235 RepID=UPI001E64DDBC|nr:MBL fold metallo-hydrolase [Stenotrophomonas sp. SY1]MCD9086632.1 MBL fold metallo-hydrolase [Stenotrophomonas sp. SY1]
MAAHGHHGAHLPEGFMMKIQQIRNATLIVELAGYRILVDPMLAAKGALPPLRVLSGLRRNPLVALPDDVEQALQTVTHCLITHCQKGHFDHLDRAGKRWLRERRIPVICTPHDAAYLHARGLNVHSLPESHGTPSPFLGGSIRTVPCVHGQGVVGRFMEHGVGYLIEVPGEPSLYLAGDTVLTDVVRNFVSTHQPDVCVIPAGGARFDIGGEIIMGLEEAVAFTRISSGIVIANHLEALSHCPVRRSGLAAAAVHAGVAGRLRIPADGEVLEFAALSR